MIEVREEIDRVDRLIVPLLIERLDYIKQAGGIKQDRNTVRDSDRIEDVVQKCLETAATLKGDPQMVEDIYRYIIEWSINHEFSIWDHHNR